MVHKLKTIRADMLVLQCQLERELIRYVRRYLCQPQVTIITNDKQFAFMCELYDYVENTELPPEMVSSLMKTKNVLELSWDEWLMNAEVEDMEDIEEDSDELFEKLDDEGDDELLYDSDLAEDNMDNDNDII